MAVHTSSQTATQSHKAERATVAFEQSVRSTTTPATASRPKCTIDSDSPAADTGSDEVADRDLQRVAVVIRRRRRGYDPEVL